MEKKYYDIIVSIVKQSEKYAGCEPILDDIVQDVYEHSKVVLGSVTNEDVINAYLNKVVATSLITVPKKLNFNTRNKHRIISNVEAITNVSISPKPVEPVVETVQLQSFEPSVTEEELDFEVEEPLTEIVEEPVETKAEIEPSEEFFIDEPVETSFEIEETTSIEEVSNEAEIEFFETIEDVEEPPIQEVDKNLVDKMINGVDLEPSEQEELSLMEETELESDFTFENIDEPALEIEEKEEVSFIEEEPEAFEFEDATTEQEEFLSLEQADEEPELAVEEPETTFELPNFECFSYEPEAPEFNEEEICAELKELDSKHPEKKLLEVCKLKYEKNQSIAEIAESLDFSEEAVLDTLNDIIELVKD